MTSDVKGKLFVVAAPSGAGKTSLVKALTEDNQLVTVAVSHTTRKIRPNEQEGINYYFTSPEAFANMEAQGAFVESASVFGHCYGTSQKEISRILSSGIHLILEIDWQGARQIRQRMPASESVYILPPSRPALRERLQNRGQDDIDTINQRMTEAISEMSHYDEFDHLLINDDFQTTLAQLGKITLENCKDFTLEHQSGNYAALLSDLLQ